MNLVRGQKWLPVLNVVVIVACAILLFLEYNRGGYLNRSPALGQVIFQIGRTQNKASSQVIFQELTRNGSVHEGDTVRTARAAEVMLQLKGGARIELEEFSMVVINRPEKKMRLRYSYGTLRVRKNQGQELSIVTGNGSVLVHRGDVRISRGKNGETEVVVESGSARVRTGSGTSTVRAGNKTVLGGKITPLLLAQASPRDGKRILGEGAEFKVDFRWKFGAPTSGRTRLEISGRRDFRGIVLRRNVPRPETRLRLSPGIYYWRVVRGDRTSDPRRLFLIRIPRLQVLSPRPDSVFEYFLRNPSIQFSWRRHAFARSYGLDIARDMSFREKLRSVETTMESLAIRLPAGEYYWRLRSAGNPSVASITGPPIRFVVRKSPLPILSPERTAEFTPEGVESSGIKFRWKAPRAGGVYHLIVARDAAFGDVLVRRSTSGTELNLKLAFRPGKYYWRLRLEKAGRVARSLDREFTIRTPLDPPEIIFPARNVVVDMSHRESLPLRWRAAKGVKRYRLSLTQESTGRRVFSRTVVGTSYRFRDLVKLDTGKFSWSIASVDKRNRAGKTRKTSFTITLRATPGAPEIKVPR